MLQITARCCITEKKKKYSRRAEMNSQSRCSESLKQVFFVSSIDVKLYNKVDTIADRGKEIQVYV